MVDAVLETAATVGLARKRSGGLRRALQRKSTIAFFLALPLILLVGILVVYPAFYSLHLATLNKSMEHWSGWETSSSCSSAKPSGWW